MAPLKNRERVILTLKKIQTGELDINQVKKLLNAPELSGTLPAPWPEGLQTEIPIRTDFEFVYLNYPPDPEFVKFLETDKLITDTPHLEVAGIVIAKRMDERFKMLEPDSEYIISIPKPGIEVYTLSRYNGPMTIAHELKENDFVW